MMNRDIFKIIREAVPEKENIIFTLTDGESAGEKAVISEKKMVFSYPADGFLSKHENSLKDVTENGITTVDGMKVYAERLAQKKKLIVCGAGHVALSVIKIARMLGFYVICLDDRPLFARNAEEVGADQVIQDDFSKAFDTIKSDRDTYFVIVTREHKYDILCLLQVIHTENAYIGLMSSKKRAALVRRRLLEEGVSEDIINNIHSPVGLDINAKTPSEIAVSIMAEIINVKNGYNNNTYFTDEILDALLSESNSDERMILAQIIGRNGSAPQCVGSKMLILPDGKTIGTIGGGCLEANVIKRAQRMLDENDKKAEIYHTTLTEIGMVCGGTVDVFIEIV